MNNYCVKTIDPHGDVDEVLLFDSLKEVKSYIAYHKERDYLLSERYSYQIFECKEIKL